MDGESDMTSADHGLGKFLALFFAYELQAWRGNTRLGVVFWVYGVIVSHLLVVLHAAAINGGQWGVLQSLILISAAYIVWILVAIWRCADNAEPFWGALARWLTIAWGLNSIFLLLFLQFDLLARQLQP